MRRALLMLELQDRAVFSARGATEGEHRSLDHVPGSSLLGWAASQCYPGVEDPFAVFHSGHVRFSNALPLTATGEPAYPVPQILRQAKNEGGGTKNGRLVPGRVWVGSRKKPNENDTIVQIEAMRDYYVSATGEVVEPAMGRRLKTAIKDDRALTGQLFGYSHLEAGQRFLATIEADVDAISEADWRRLLQAFGDGKTGEIRLGRSRSVEYGGRAIGFCDELQPKDADWLWPSAGGQRSDTLIVVWALSDLALVDAGTGEPTLSPRLADMLPAAQGQLGRLSAISQRRYAPWNAYLNMRETERAVIGAGSVLIYEGAKCAPSDLPHIVGLHQERGLGRIWVNPPMLGCFGHHPIIETRDATLPERLAKAGSHLDNWRKSSVSSDTTQKYDPLLQWMRTRRDAASTADRDEAAEAWVHELETLYKTARTRAYNDGVGPSASQWGEVGATVRDAKGKADLITRLFETKSPVCGGEK